MVPPIRTGWPSQLQIKETNSVELTVTVGQGNNVFAPPPPQKKNQVGDTTFVPHASTK